jgi:2-dehydro-3-deoxyphosphooctonate aldolase (KDO 8-P synthase)
MSLILCKDQEGLGDRADGRGSSVFELARAGMSLGLAGLFLETHPNPEDALCDGPLCITFRRLR